MSLPEKLTPEQYPNINWSKEYIHADGHPADSFGLVQIRVEDRVFVMEWRKGQRLWVPYATAGADDSMVAFGRPGVTQLQAFSSPSELFSLEDYQRINNIGVEARKLVMALHQRSTAEAALKLTERLKITLKSSMSWEGLEVAEEAGLIEKFIESQKSHLLSDKILAAARELQRLKVVRFNEGYGLHGDYNGPPEWFLEVFSLTP